MNEDFYRHKLFLAAVCLLQVPKRRIASNETLHDISEKIKTKIISKRKIFIDSKRLNQIISLARADGTRKSFGRSSASRAESEQLPDWIQSIKFSGVPLAAQLTKLSTGIHGMRRYLQYDELAEPDYSPQIADAIRLAAKIYSLPSYNKELTSFLTKIADYSQLDFLAQLADVYASCAGSAKSHMLKQLLGYVQSLLDDLATDDPHGAIDVSASCIIAFSENRVEFLNFASRLLVDTTARVNIHILAKYCALISDESCNWNELIEVIATLATNAVVEAPSYSDWRLRYLTNAVQGNQPCSIERVAATFQLLLSSKFEDQIVGLAFLPFVSEQLAAQDRRLVFGTILEDLSKAPSAHLRRLVPWAYYNSNARGFPNVFGVIARMLRADPNDEVRRQAAAYLPLLASNPLHYQEVVELCKQEAENNMKEEADIVFLQCARLFPIERVLEIIRVNGEVLAPDLLAAALDSCCYRIHQRADADLAVIALQIIAESTSACDFNKADCLALLYPVSKEKHRIADLLLTLQSKNLNLLSTHRVVEKNVVGDNDELKHDADFNLKSIELSLRDCVLYGLRLGLESGQVRHCTDRELAR